MMTTVIEIGFGVFNPKGELEAVSLSEGEANFYAENLSPKQGNAVMLNRKVEEVTILVGSFDLSDESLYEIADCIRRQINERKQFLTQTDGTNNT